MALNEIFKHSDWISLPVPEDTESGQAVGIGQLSGVAQTAEGDGGNDDGFASIALTGAFKFEGVTVAKTVGQAVTVGDVGGVGATGILLGHAITSKTGASGPLTVRLAGHAGTGA